MRLAVLKNNVPTDQVLVETPDPGERYEIYVGRAEDCHVRIDDPLISRHHFVITNDSEHWTCRKLTKLGAVTVNGADAQGSTLQNGDEIRCGVYSVVVTELNDLPGAPATRDFKVAHTSVTEPVPTAPLELAPDAVVDEPILDEALDSVDPLSEETLEAPAEESPFGSDEPFEENPGSEEDAFLGEVSEEAPVSDAFSEGELVPQDEFGIAALEEEEKTRVDMSFVNYELVLFGEHAPYDRYVISEAETFIGRDPKKCQIVLTDPEVSSVHSVVKKNGSMVLLEDLNSSNGTILNGERINRSAVMPGDEFVIGSTSFTLQVKSDLMNAERDRLMPVEQGQVIETEEIEEEIVDSEDAVAFDSDAPVEKSLLKRIWKDPVKKRRFLMVAGVALLLLFLWEPEEELPSKPKASTKTQAAANPNKRMLSPAEQKLRDTEYELGVAAFELMDFNKAIVHFETVNRIDPEYKNIATYLKQTKEGIKQVAELEKQRREEEARIKLKKVIDELLTKAREAVKERQVVLAENLFSQITEKDPDNMEVQQLKFELEAWQKEEERKALELAAKEAARKRMVDALSPGKTLYLKKEWYKAIVKLEDFLQKKGMDEDLIKEASDMLADAKNELASELGPVIGKARSLKEGQDLKAAYESFQEVLKLEPTNAEALNEVDEIRSLLENRSKKVYREAIIAESLSLFNDAKEKFQEVQQISPTDSDYYKKASDKLRNYLE